MCVFFSVPYVKLYVVVISTCIGAGDYRCLIPVNVLLTTVSSYQFSKSATISNFTNDAAIFSNLLRRAWTGPYNLSSAFINLQ